MEQPQWHKRPTGPGLWVCWGGDLDPQIIKLTAEDIAFGAPFRTDQVYGPIPEPESDGE